MTCAICKQDETQPGATSMTLEQGGKAARTGIAVAIRDYLAA